jgi:hypothetical protein
MTVVFERGGINAASSAKNVLPSSSEKRELLGIVGSAGDVPRSGRVQSNRPIDAANIVGAIHRFYGSASGMPMSCFRSDKEGSTYRATRRSVT